MIEIYLSRVVNYDHGAFIDWPRDNVKEMFVSCQLQCFENAMGQCGMNIWNFSQCIGTAYPSPNEPWSPQLWFKIDYQFRSIHNRKKSAISNETRSWALDSRWLDADAIWWSWNS